MKRPICIAAISSIIGIIMGLYLQSIASFLFAIFLFTIGICFFVFQKVKNYPKRNQQIIQTKIIQTILLSCIFSLSFFSYCLFLENHYQTIYQNYDSKECHFVAIVLATQKEKEYQTIYEIKVTQVNQKKIYPFKLLLQVKTQGNQLALRTRN